MKVLLGCQPITWKGDLATAAKEIAEIGFRGMEVGVPRDKRGMDRLRKLLDTYGLAATGCYFACSFLDRRRAEEEIRTVTEWARRLVQIQCPRLILASSHRPHDRVLDRELFELFADGCNETARRCFLEHGVETVLHNHAWTLMESPEEVDLICEMTDPKLVGMGFDTAHLAYGGGNPAHIFRKHIERVRYVHFKDLHQSLKRFDTIEKKNANKPEHVFVELGEGCLGERGLVAVLNVLRKAKYEGWIVAELDSTSLAPKEANAMNYRWLREHLRENELGECQLARGDQQDET